MSAELLRRAADRLDELTKAATPGPWVPEGGWSVAGPTPDGWGGGPHLIADTKWRSDTAYIATMHPGVGKALAEWFRTFSECVVDDESLAASYFAEVDSAVDVARAILGESEPTKPVAVSLGGDL